MQIQKQQIDLSENWKLRHERMKTKIEEAPLVLKQAEGWMDVSLPCDIHEALIDNGIIADPGVGLNCFQGEWTEKKSWWYVKRFTLDESFLSYDVIELSAEVLDVYADIRLNGCQVARHTSAFYGFSKNVKKYLQPGENELVIRLTTGLEYCSEDEMMDTEMEMVIQRRRDDSRRCMVRKPQYSFGWDWCPRVGSCGILSPVYLTGLRDFVVRSAYVSTETVTPLVQATCHVEVENLHELRTRDVVVHMQILDDGLIVAQTEKECVLTSGINYIDYLFQLENVRLWWPNGAGNPDLYTVRVWVESSETIDEYPTFRTGFRTFTVRQDKLGENEHEFAFTVNGVKIYSKGGNFVPADILQSRITPETYRALTNEAVNANFNLLRVWGGGLYERHAFYDCCDELGIMVWQDFAFACSVYPETENFYREVEREMDFQTRRLRRHTSLVLFCGNNEMHMGFDGGYPPDKQPYVFGGGTYYNHLAPKILRANAPHIYYWNGSPYGGADNANGDKMGDAHIWFTVPWNKTEDRYVTPEAHDQYIHSKFVSEYGYLGACCKETTEQYMGEAPLDMDSDIWQYHMNNQNLDNWSAEWINALIETHYCSASGLTTEEFLLYSGLCQGLMYEYSISTFRSRPDNYGTVFWMYNDCWGEVGWTIIDHYLRRKISFPYVRRAFAPRMLILRRAGDKVVVTGVNDTPNPISFTAEYGYFRFDGTERRSQKTALILPAFTRKVVLEFPWEENDPVLGSWFVQPQESDTGIMPVILRQAPFRTLKTPDPGLTTSGYMQKNGEMTFTVSAEAYAHAVHFNFPCNARLNDEYFDLLPGESRRIIVTNLPSTYSGEPQVKSILNTL